MNRIPLWVLYVFSFILLHIGSHISVLVKHDLGVSDFYLPTAISIILVYWFGPRVVLPVLYLNGVITSPLWGTNMDKWLLWFIYAIPETIFCFSSWFFFVKLLRGKYWFPDNRNTASFLLVGAFIPAVLESTLLQSMLILFGGLSTKTLAPYIFSNLVSEFATTFFLTLPVLYYFTPLLQQIGIINPSKKKIPRPEFPDKKEIIMMIIVFATLLLLVFFLEFRTYWYIYGFFSLSIAIRLGFGPAIITNLFIVFITYIIPKFVAPFGSQQSINFSNVGDLLLGANSLFVFVAIAGRVISDLKNAEAKLRKRNEELKQTNLELDRFVYSVSHDLNAPLKTVLGIVNISRLTDDRSELRTYFSMIERSIRKLEAFIFETLDYSRNKRQNFKPERIELRELCGDILENLVTTALDAPQLKIRYKLEEPEIWTDRTRLRIILHNILSNAVRFQKSDVPTPPSITVSSRKIGDLLLIQIEDNGEGIPVDQQRDIFRMFYRGSEKSSGSGLGLYIAKEAATRIGGNISVQSSAGKGAIFTVKIRLPRQYRQPQHSKKLRQDSTSGEGGPLPAGRDRSSGKATNS